MNYTVLRIWGIPIRINISLIVFLPILAYLIGSDVQLAAYATIIEAMTPAAVDPDVLAETDRWLVGTTAAVGLFASVLLHELGHSYVAMRYDIEVESITLWVLGGLASLSEMPREWNREFWIAIAGPVTSILVGVSAIGALAVIPESATVLVFAVGFLAVMNIILAVFNMLPAFPMDGGRILRALLARNRSYASATRTASKLGVFFAILFVFLGIVVTFSPILVLLALFIYVAATSESRAVMLGELLSGLTVEDVISDSAAVSADATVEEAFDQVLRSRRSDLAVVDSTGAVVGVVTASTLRSVKPDEYRTAVVRDIATTDLPRVDGSTAAFDVLYEMMGDRSDVVLVERDGQVVGPVSRGDFADVLAIRGETVAF